MNKFLTTSVNERLKRQKKKKKNIKYKNWVPSDEILYRKELLKDKPHTPQCTPFMDSMCKGVLYM
jgi:hypothetical protein